MSIPTLAAIQSRIEWVQEALSLGLKRSGREAGDSPTSARRLRMCGTMPHLPHTSSWRRT